MKNTQKDYGLRRIYEIQNNNKGSVALNLSDRIIDLGHKELDLYKKISEWLPSNSSIDSLVQSTGLDITTLERFISSLEHSNMLYKHNKIPEMVTGLEFHTQYFSKILPSWLSEAFSHPFWE